ncbi:pre-rRNA-processing protein Ipi1p [[Candida] anglica]|uniref:Pre-rRNA-processing protein n=1 Tax=[Candida] anglica TaxID=148631 RepID=A0ABP0EJZ5_9ASCO
MGSKRKKAEKQKDFVKKKLKVGKTAAKPDNHTDTSFTARAISLPNQSLNRKQAVEGLAEEKREEVDLSHHLALVKHHSASTRKEVLIYIEQHLPSNPSLYKQIITSIVPLIVDQSQNVRNALVSLLNACAREKPGLLDLHLKAIVLFIHSAMTHIQPDIRNSASKFLAVLIEHSPDALVRSYFIKTMKAYFTLLAWTLTDDKKSVSLAITTSASTGGATKKARIGHVAVFKKFLEAALFANESDNATQLIDITNTSLIHPLSGKYLIPTATRAYSPLKLFVKEMTTNNNSSSTSSGSGTSGANSGVDDGSFTLDDLPSLSTEDLSTRRKVMIDVFSKPSVKNLTNFIKEGGEVGREAHSCLAVITKLKSEEVEKAATV